jgi:hypothetical protein
VPAVVQAYLPWPPWVIQHKSAPKVAKAKRDFKNISDNINVVANKLCQYKLSVMALLAKNNLISLFEKKKET